MLLILSFLTVLLNAEVVVSPYGGKVLALSEGGRAFIRGFDSIRINPAGCNLIDSSEVGLAAGIGGSFVSLSVGYVDESGFHILFASRDIDKNFTVDGLETYAGFSYELSKWWIFGANVGYNYVSLSNGWDMNLGVDFGPAVASHIKSGLIGSMAVRNPFQHGGVREVSAAFGYSFKSAFNMTVDNVMVFRNNEKHYDIIFAVESLPLGGDFFSMTFSARITDIGGDENLRIGAGFGYVDDEYRFDFGVYFTDIDEFRFRNVIFGLSYVYGV